MMQPISSDVCVLVLISFSFTVLVRTNYVQSSLGTVHYDVCVVAASQHPTKNAKCEEQTARTDGWQTAGGGGGTQFLKLPQIDWTSEANQNIAELRWMHDVHHKITNDNHDV